jgi:nlpC/P60 family protein
MNKNEKASVSLKKIICLSILVILIFSGIGVMASNVSLNNVKIILSNGYEMTVITSKTNIAEILDENNVVLTEEERTVPDLEEELSDNKTIKIVKGSEDLEESEGEKEEAVSIETVLANYAPIVEKIVTEEVEIPFETITKESSSTTGEKQNRVIREGRNGLKEVTYKVKYQNDAEIEKTVISEKVIKEPVNKVVQVTYHVYTSRGGDRVSSGKWSYTASELDLLCAITAQECGSSYNGALAVITTACNRAESSKWRSRGTDPLSQYKAKGQFCYSIDNHWKKRLNGNYPSYVEQAVLDALNGARNHNFLSFRSAGTHSGTVIGGNAYFNPM